jgi:uncharacterized protein (DUF362 family)/NAD-dependent dihydropyrimidine dehydrogenase PreA subunit
MNPHAPVALLECSNYHRESVSQTMYKMLDSLKLGDLSGKRVLIKPNILIDAHPKKAVTTHPSVVYAAASYVRDNGGIPAVGDSPSIQRPGFKPKRCGIQDVCNELDIPWLDFTDGSVQRGRFPVTRHVEETDMIFNLAKLKTHRLMYYTGAVKNIFGLIGSLSKSPYHLRHPDRNGFADMLIDLNEEIKPAVHIIDGIISMEGEGPSSGRPVKTGVLIASTSPYAADLAALSVIGEDAQKIPTARRAFRRGVCPSEAEYLFESPEEHHYPGFDLVPKSRAGGFGPFFISQIKRLLPSKPHPDPAPLIRENTCIACLACFDICPADAIITTESALRVEVDPSVCIRCYCCHEVCPVGAITVRKT